MKKIKMFFVSCSVSLIYGFAGAQGHNHVKHNMVLFGEVEIFASHIVFKSPHNYQVILKVSFNEVVLDAYLLERKHNPHDQFIFLLDEMHIADIGTAKDLTGVIFRKDSSGQKWILAKDVKVSRNAFEIVFFNELPLSLQ